MPPSFFASCGSALAGWDANDDGLSDLAMGALFSNTVHVIFGTTSRVPVRLTADLNGANGFSVAGPPAVSFGSVLARAGRANFDTYEDLLIGSPEETVNGSNSAGRVYALMGRTSFPAWIDASTLDGTNGFMLSGQQAGARAGNAVASAGRFNNDEIDDVLLGAWLHNYGEPAATKSGAAYLVSPLGIARTVLGIPELYDVTYSNGFISLAWFSQPGVNYELRASVSLQAPWDHVTNAPSGGDTTRWEIFAASGSNAFYRVLARP